MRDLPNHKSETELELISGDITTIAVDAIVNAANSSLLGGGGVDGAIHTAGGPSILAACKQIRARDGGCATGDAVITTAGRLPARHVIHTVGPVWGSVDDAEAIRLLASCYRSSLNLAAARQCRTIAFPNISTGVYGFPKAQAAQTGIDTVQSWIDENAGLLDRVVYVCFDEENHSLYTKTLG